VTKSELRKGNPIERAIVNAHAKMQEKRGGCKHSAALRVMRSVWDNYLHLICPKCGTVAYITEEAYNSIKENCAKEKILIDRIIETI
jgi:phage FluMu protein Com